MEINRNYFHNNGYLIFSILFCCCNSVRNNRRDLRNFHRILILLLHLLVGAGNMFKNILAISKIIILYYNTISRRTPLQNSPQYCIIYLIQRTSYNFVSCTANHVAKRLFLQFLNII